MGIYKFLVGNSRLLIWVFIGVMVFWGYNQAQQRKLDAQRIQTLETTVTQLSATVSQMADTMTQTAALMQKFNQMAEGFETEKARIQAQAGKDKAANEKDLSAADVGAVRIPDSVIKRLQQSADAARSASGSATLSADAPEPDAGL